METLSDIDISPAAVTDLCALHDLIERAYRGETARAGWTHEADLVATPRTDLATLAAIVADPDQALLLARDGRAIIGCVQVTRRSASACYLGLLTVDPALQASGLGKRLLEAAEAEAVRRGARTMELSVISRRSELIAYYERRGYRPTGAERPFPIVLDPPLVLRVLERALARSEADHAAPRGAQP